MKTTKFQAAVAGVAVLIALSACSTTDTSANNADAGSKTSNTADISEGVQPDPAAVALLPASYKEKGELSVAMDLHYPPTTFLADDNKTPIGLNPDIARLVAKKLGLKLDFVNTSFDTIIPGIDARTRAADLDLAPSRRHRRRPDRVAIGPTAVRVRGLYLAIVTLGLVFIGEYVWRNWTSLTGGAQVGRDFPRSNSGSGRRSHRSST